MMTINFLDLVVCLAVSPDKGQVNNWIDKIKGDRRKDLLSAEAIEEFCQWYSLGRR